VTEPRLSAALRAELIEDLAQLLVRARRRRLAEAERTNPRGGITVVPEKINVDGSMVEGPA